MGRNKFYIKPVAPGKTEYHYKCNSCQAVNIFNHQLTDLELHILPTHRQPNCRYITLAKPYTITMMSLELNGDSAMRRLEVC